MAWSETGCDRVLWAGERANDGRIKQHEIEGGSFSVTNLGMYGTKEFAAILNPPQSGILAVGAAHERPWVVAGAVGEVSWAVRSSATAEDMPDASFAGQQETFLNVTGIDNILLGIKKVFASLDNDRAIACPGGWLEVGRRWRRPCRRGRGWWREPPA